jgi:hypothetical protein
MHLVACNCSWKIMGCEISPPPPPPNNNLSFKRKETLQNAICGNFGGFRSANMLLLARNLCTYKVEWLGALSCQWSQSPPCHLSCDFHHTFSLACDRMPRNFYPQFVCVEWICGAHYDACQIKKMIACTPQWNEHPWPSLGHGCSFFMVSLTSQRFL